MVLPIRSVFRESFPGFQRPIEISQNSLSPSQYGAIHHLPVDSDYGPIGYYDRLRHTPRPCHVFASWPKTLIDQMYLPGVNTQLRAKAKAFRAQCVATYLCRGIDRCRDSINRWLKMCDV